MQAWSIRRINTHTGQHQPRIACLGCTQHCCMCDRLQALRVLRSVGLRGVLFVVGVRVDGRLLVGGPWHRGPGYQHEVNTGAIIVRLGTTRN